MKQAKIQITGDAKGFKKQVEEAKRSLDSLGRTQAVGDPTKTLSQQIVDLEKKIKNLNETKALLAKGGIKDSELDAWKKLNQEVKEHKKLLKEAKATREALSNTPSPKDSGVGGGGGTGGDVSPLLNMGKIKSALAMVAGGAGMISMYNRRQQMATERMPIRALTTDMGLPSERSQLGFTPEERRQRAQMLAKQASPMKGRDLESLMNMGEGIERAYGISGEESAAAVGAARRAGVSDQGRFLKNAVGGAVGAGLEGPQVAEYLSSMTNFLSDMSKGINIDTDSMQGFASAIGGLPFFKNDPSRIFDAIRGMDQAMRGGDEFQKAQGARAISQAAGPGAPSAMIEYRRRMGMFGKIDDATMKKLEGVGVNTSALKVGGGEIMSNIFKDIMGTTKGMTQSDRMAQFQSRSGMSEGAGAAIFAELASAEKKGVKPDFGKISGIIKQDQKSPEEKMADRIEKVMGTMDGTMKSVNTTFQNILDQMATNIGEPMANLANAIERLIGALGGNTDKIGGGLGTAAVVGGTALGLAGTFGGKGLLSKVGTGLGNVASKGGSLLGRVGAGIGGVGESILGMMGSGLGLAATGVGAALYSPSVGEGSDIVPQGAKPFDFSQYQVPEKKSINNFTSPGPSGEATTTDSSTDLKENTMSLKELTMALKQKAGVGGGSRIPSYAQSAGRNMAAGK